MISLFFSHSHSLVCEKQHTNSFGLYLEGVIVILLRDPDSRVISVNYVLQDSPSKIDFHSMNVSHMSCMNLDTFGGMHGNVSCTQMQGFSPISAQDRKSVV